jgi:hypothetical protein
MGSLFVWQGAAMLETTGTTMFEWLIGETLKHMDGVTDNARRGGSLEFGPNGRSITGQRLVVSAGASL